MNMANRIFITIALLGTSLAGTAWSGTVSTGFLGELNVFLEQNSGPTFFAKNDQQKPSEGVSTDDTSKTHKDTNRSEHSTQGKDVLKKIKPMEPFIPSETIPVDQEVDLPYDI